MEEGVTTDQKPPIDAHFDVSGMSGTLSWA